jgi:hypothetical protein
VRPSANPTSVPTDIPTLFPTATTKIDVSFTQVCLFD